MKTSIFLPALLRKRGVALILVVSVLSLLTILMLAMFSATDNEFKSTQGYVASQDARRLGDIAVNVDISQLQQASVPVPNATGIGTRYITATQPGAVRRYTLDGAFNAAFKLYSAPQMQVYGGSSTDELNVVTADIPPADWDTQSDRYVDLNEPIIRASVANSSLAAELYFPIVDPRGYRDANPQGTGTPPAMVNIEGFSYSTKAPASNSTTADNTPGQVVGSDIHGIVLPTGNNAASNAQRLPMPVTWLYVLQDGSLGTLDSNKNYNKAPGSSDPSADNPIVGRVAFWTDDESAKINVNTAAEGTFWGTPRFFHDRERTWAEKPPTAQEYQRFPGHPATVALSSVFFPDINGVNSFDFYNQPAGATLTANMEKIRRIYDIVPKISRGGSDFGTYVYAVDDTSSVKAATPVSMAESVTERLYASLDELLFSHDMTGSVRMLNDDWVPSDAGVPASPIVDRNTYGRDTRQTIEQARFFLTANSRSPEFNIFGTPRVCMWPISYFNDSDHRTVYDKLIAFCSTLKGSGDNSYYFQRKNAHDSVTDIGLDRNNKLLKYLQALTNLPMPATSPYTAANAGTATTLKDKYKQDSMNTLLVEIFDYIRSTNLYDDLLADKNVQTSTTGKSETQTYTDAPADFYTYTNPLRYNSRTSDQGGNPVTPRIVADDGWPGHGTVSPSIWSVGSTKYRGMARFFTISEVGLHFICTADGGNGSGQEAADHSYLEPVSGKWSGGRGVERIDPNVSDVYRNEGASNTASYFKTFPQSDNKAWWWSNYPPKPLRDQYGTLVAKYLQKSTQNPNLHPGYDPVNWNCTLDPASPLAPKEKRIQAMVDLEIFCPAAGWTLLNPEWTIVLGTPGQDNPISGIQVNNKSLWSTANKVYVVKSNKNLFSVSTAVGRSGGSVSPSAIYNGRKVGGNQNLPKDVGYDDSGNASASGHLGLDNCDLASGFVTISNQPTMSIKFTNLNGLPISLYDTHNWQNAQPIQTFMVNLAAGGATITTPTPELVSVSSNKRTYTSGGVRHIQRAVDAPHFWCFQYSGCVGRYQLAGGQSITPLNIDSASYASAVSEGTLSGRLGGRFRLEGDASTVQAQGGDYNTVVTANGTSTSIAGSNALIFAMTTPGLFDKKSGKSYEQLFGSDVVRSVIPAGGDYRILACRYSVPAAMWQPHRLWQAQFTNAGGQSSFYYSAHNFSSSFTDDSGFDLNLSTASQPNLPQFIRAYPSTNAVNMGVRMPDIPQGSLGGATAGLDALNSFLDFDNGPGDTRDGSYCNKPDEGNFSALNYAFSVGEKTYRNGYFYTSYEMEPDKTASNAYFTPNRLISSPVMFGSLVTSVFDVPSVATVTGYSGGGRPWQTLLFRPHVQPTQAGPAAASFAGSVAPVSGSLAYHPGAQNPPDHYLLDLFSMPVVEPYAISEPLSTAGKLNLNYQIVPFTYIRRATGVYAAMKGELMRAVSISDNGNKNNPLTTAYTYKNAITAASGQTMPVFPPVYFWTETGSTVATQQPAANNHYWHRRIDPAETTKQLDERFLMNTSSIYPDRRKGLLRSASQICEIHMIPANPPSVPTGMYTMPGPSTALNREDNMKKFWSVHALTGDNSREEIYSHLYPKFTTRSNTFRVHVRAQALKKSRTTSVSSFSTADGDKVLSEYRGSYLLERYIDPNDATNLLPNYGAGGDPTAALSLESYYRFHILEVKRFAP